MILKNDLKRKNTNIIEINTKMQFNASELNKTNQILMELPLFQNLLIEKEELEEQVKMLKHNIMYFESANRKILRKVEKLKMEIKSLKKSKKTKIVKETSAGSDSCFATLEATLEDDDDDEVVFIKQEKIFEPIANNTIVIDLCKDDEPAIKMVIEEPDEEETSAGSDSCKATLEGEEETEEVVEVETSAGSDSCKATLEGEEEEEEEEEEEAVEIVEGEEEEEVEIVETEEEEAVEIVEGEEEEEVEIVETEEEEVEIVEGEEEEEVEIVEGEEEEEVEIVETEEEVVEGEGEEEEDVYEIEINGKTYYVSNEKNSVIYAADEDGEITIEAGVYKNGKPIFN